MEEISIIKSNLHISSSKSLKNCHKISVAPMMGITNRHFRYFMRLLTKETLLYTEMIHHDAILNCKDGYKKLLDYDNLEHPLVLQLGGNNPELLGKCAKIAKTMGYDEINLNCGCPSTKVIAHNFGACLMKTPELVGECVKEIKKNSNIPVSVKCRLGLNNDNDTFLNDFILKVNRIGEVDHFVIHARLAIMNLDTDKNRKIPPLRYDRVFQLKKDFPNINYTINGGIKTYDDISNLLSNNSISGCMIGRAAYDNPWIFSQIDELYYGKKNPGYNRKELLYKYGEYGDYYLNSCLNNIYDKEKIYPEIITPLTFLFNGEKLNSFYKSCLMDKNNWKDVESFYDFIVDVVEKYEIKNKEALERYP